MPEQNPRRILEHVEALHAFNDAYVALLDAGPAYVDPLYAEHYPPGPSAEERAQLRSNVLVLIPAAQDALNEAGMGIVVRSPPLMPSRDVYSGLANVAFLFEQSDLWGDTARHVLDVVRMAAAELQRQFEALQGKRRNPLYWGDRAVSALFRFPAYLVAKVVGVPTVRIERSVLGLVLRIAEAAIGVVGIYLAGKQLGWW